MTSHTAGLHNIVHAEKKAAKIISEARQRKVKRLRQAKEEASKLVDELSKEKEQQFRAFEEEFSNSNSDVVKRINEETDLKLEQMEIEYNERKVNVIEQLLKSVVSDINPRLHYNLRLQAKTTD